MNPLTAKALDQINEALDDLDQILQERAEKIKTQHEEREDVLKENWRRSKEIAVLEHGRKEYEELAEEHRILSDNQKKLTEHLRRLLDCTKAFNSELRA
jgi:hypothetical protein